MNESQFPKSVEIPFEDFNKLCIDRGWNPFPFKSFIFVARDSNHYTLELKEWGKTLNKHLSNELDKYLKVS